MPQTPARTQAGPPGDSPEYILGADSVEIARLRFQHKVWVEQCYAFLTRCGLRAGHAALDIGSGPGYTTLELATIVGERGRVIAVDESAMFLDSLRAECARFGLGNVTAVQSKVEALDIEADAFDLAYARWLFCWLEEPEPAMARAARALKPGGALALQEYLNWGAMCVLPANELVTSAIAACRRSWDHGGGDIDIARRLPEIAPRLGLTLEYFEPIARMGGVGSLEWQWVGTFLRDYLPKVAKMGLYDEREYPAFLAEWGRLENEGLSHIFTPVMSEAILRKQH